MNILITGSNSFIAKYLINILSDDKIILFQKSKNDLPRHNNYSIIEYNLFHPKESTKKLTSIPDIGLLFAWYGTRGKKRNSFFLQFLNYFYSIKLLSELIRIGTKRFFIAGSQAEYNINILDSHFSWYGYFKLKTVSWLSRRAFHDNDIRYIEGRFFSIYGFGDYQKSLISYLISNMTNGNNVYVSYGNIIWNYLYVEDAANAVKLLIHNEKSNGSYDIASMESLKLNKYIEIVKRVLNSNSVVNYYEVKKTSQEKDLIPKTNRLLSEIGTYENHSFEQGILKIISYIETSGQKLDEM
jgi:UDP-glucose 4-epimerase